MSFSLNTNFERVSEEAHGDAFPFLNSNDQFSDLNLEFLQDESLFADIPVNGTCDLSDIAGRLKVNLNEKRKISSIVIFFARSCTQLC